MLKSHFQRFYLKKSRLNNRNSLLLNKSSFEFEESYKTLRTNLQFVCADKNVKKIIVTSSVPGEGKTTVAINLAISLSQVGHKVLVMDLDLRKPKIHQYLKLQNFPGITNVLSKTNNLVDSIQFIEELNIYTITSGPIPPNPSELLQTNKMTEIVERLDQLFDYVIMDTPPSSYITDASVLSNLADGVLLVIHHGGITFEAVSLALENLKKAGANILGSLLNMVNTDKTGRYSYYKSSDYKYYSSYYNDDLKSKKNKR